MANHEKDFRMEQTEAVLSVWGMIGLRALQMRSSSSWPVRAIQSLKKSALSRNHSRSMGLKSGL